MVWLACTSVNVYVLTAPTETPSTTTFAMLKHGLAEERQQLPRGQREGASTSQRQFELRTGARHPHLRRRAGLALGFTGLAPFPSRGVIVTSR
mgnify:CR=1 FL=1